MRVGVERGPSWAATTPTLLVKEGYFTTTGDNRPHVRHRPRRPAVPDDQGGRRRGPTAAPPSLIVVQHWVEELKRLVPVK